jgi:hypothetical protein
MPRPFLELTLEEFASLVRQFPWRRKITEVHVHHTFRPNHTDFAARPPVDAIEGMFRFHTEERHFSDIAQHATIDPRGKIWTGRNWNNAPASATGCNGNSAMGPFMFEMIGNFDTGNNPWDGAQRDAAIEVIARIQQRFGLPPEAMKFHNEMSPKSCPGASIVKSDAIELVRDAHTRLAAAPRAARKGAFDESASAASERTELLLRMLNVDAGGRGVMEEAELPESAMTAGEAAQSAGDKAAASRLERARAADFTLSADDRAFLRPHVINLRMGALSSGGEFQTSVEDLEAIFAEHLPRELAARKAEGRKLKLVFFAHGGLNDEAEGLRNALNHIPFYLDNKCYPIFFVWETGPKETLVDILKGIIGLAPSRGFGEALLDRINDFSDAALEGAFRGGGFSMWANMKRSAELAFVPRQGGTLVVDKLAAFWKQNHADMEIHCIGHSAGSIFHAQFLDLLCQQAVTPKVEVKTLHFLAPAITVDLFKEKLLPLIGKQVPGLTEYTMHKDFELADSVGPYRKSLLYLVSRSFEDRREMPILGLEESIRKDIELTRFFGLAAGKKGVAEILFSVQEAGPRNSTISRKHSDFDNDRPTMAGVMRRILDVPDSQSIVEFPETVSRSVLDLPPRAAPPGGRRRALCVGIDAYPPGNELSGCVNDAKDWGAALGSLGFESSFLLNRDATWKAIRESLVGMVRGATPGDVVAFQYAGHGTLVTDLDGDEAGGKDSAMCPVDFPTGGFLIDDDLRAIFAEIPAGVNFTCFFDCCHSGTITRLVGPAPMRATGAKPRFIHATPEMLDAHKRFRAEMRFVPPAARGPATMREISFTACTDSQVALESAGHGQFTLNALGVLRKGIQGVTNAQFHQSVLAAFGSDASTQTPQLDCAPAAKALLLLAPAGEASSAPQPMDAVLARLDRIESRLQKLGV